MLRGKVCHHQGRCDEPRLRWPEDLHRGWHGGHGAAIAQRAHAKGATVVVAGRRAASVATPQPSIEALHIHIGSDLSICDFLAAVGPGDHLVVSAAFTRLGAFESDSLDARTTFDRSILLFSGPLPAAGVPALAAANGAIEAWVVRWPWNLHQCA